MWFYACMYTKKRMISRPPRLAQLGVACLLCLSLSVNVQAQDRENGQEDQAPYGGVTYGELEPVSNFNPYAQETRAVSNRLYSLLYEGLVRYNHDTEEYDKLLAEDWEIAEDRKSITFDLRPNVLWHDGEAFSARDVIFTYEYIRRRGAPQIRGQFDFITLEEVDDAHVRATFTAPVADPLQFFETWIIPDHLFEGYLPTSRDLSRRPVGTGAYKFKEKIVDRITLEANLEYWGEPGNISTLEVQKMTDPAQITQSAVLGAHQLIIQVSPVDLPLVKSSRLFRIEPYPSFGFYAFAYNTEHPVLSNILVRQAFTHATDREGMLEQWFGGNGEVIAGPFNKFAPYHDPEIVPEAYDVALANALLDEAGYDTTDSDGFRLDGNGSRLRFEVLYFREDVGTITLNANLVEAYVNFLRQVGVEVSSRGLTLDSYRRRVLTDRDFQIALVHWSFDPIYDVTSLFETGGERNISRFSSRQVDELIHLFDRELDPVARIGLMKELQRSLSKQQPYTFLLSEEKNMAFFRCLLRTRIDPFYQIRNFPQWYIDPDCRN